MDFLSRRSIRKYKSEMVSDEEIREIMKVALVSPSACNRQPYEYIVVKDKTMLETLSKVKSGGGHMIGTSAFSVVVLGDKSVSDVWIEDASIATTLLQLKAWDMGIGSCWVQMRLRTNSEGVSTELLLRDLLNIPEEKGVLAIVAFGYPDEERPVYTEENMNFSKLHFEKY